MKDNRESCYGKFPNKVVNIEDIDRYFELFNTRDRVISDEVYRDLNIEDLFNHSNHCISSVGEMILYYKLRHLSLPTDIEVKESIIERISSSEEFRGKLEAILVNLSKKTSFSISRLLDTTIALSKWHKYIKYIPFIYFCIIMPMLLSGQFAALIITSVTILIINSIIHYWNKLYVEIYIRPLIQLLAVKTAASKIYSQLDDNYHTSRLKESMDVIRILEKKLFFFTLNKQVESDFALLLNIILEFTKAVFLIEPIITHNILKADCGYKRHSKRLIDYVGEWDTLFANASLRFWLKQNEYSYSRPEFSEQKSPIMTANDIYNPLIPNCITNDLHVVNTMIITGSNMSGKSTFLRTIGINIVSSHALNICYASKMKLSRCNLYTVLSVSDDMNSSKSYFFSEVERIKFALDLCEKSAHDCNNMILIDEIFKGTNTIERIAIANAVIRYFINLKNVAVIVSTHDIELAQSLSSLLDIYHFDESLSNNEVVYDYKIKAGLEYNRNAINLLKHCDYPADIVKCAKQNARLMQKEISYMPVYTKS